MRKQLILLMAVGLLAAACTSKTPSSTTSPTATASASVSASPTKQAAQTFSVQLDGKTDAFNGEFGTFFPDELSAHPGDTIDFKLPRFSGVPHTVTLGTLVDKAIAKLQQLGVTASVEAQET